METFKKYLFDGWEIFKLNGKVAKKVAEDKNALTYAILFFVLAGVASAIGQRKFWGIFYAPIGVLIGTFIMFGIIHLLAKLFGGKASFPQFYRACGIGYIGMWISIIPFAGVVLGGIVMLWYLVVDVVILKHVHQLTTGKAVFVVLIPVIIVIIVTVILAVVLAAAIVGFLAAAGIKGMNPIFA